MMNELCLIPIEHLQEGKSVPISENFDPKFLELNDEDLSFSNPIEVNGKAYLAEDMLIIQLDMKGGASLPCSICNKKVAVPFFMKNVYITKPLTDISAGKFSYKEELREAILLEIPAYIECNDGTCPERTTIERYLKQSSDTQKKEDDVYYPFKGLEEQLKKK